MNGTIPPEYASVEAFAEDLMDCDRETFTFAEAAYLAECLRTSVSKLRKALAGYGLTMEARPIEREVRTYSTSSHDRWFGPGSSATHGGSGVDADYGIQAWSGAKRKAA